MINGKFLRDRAKRCRDLANSVPNPEIKEQLLLFAAEFDETASELDRALLALEGRASWTLR